jgi:hypothetical protein
MDRCPNCDATVRPNAKFCTSCGFRLPNPAPVIEPEPESRPEGWRSPFATTSAGYEHNQSWTAPIPPPAPAPAPVAVPNPEPAIPLAPVDVMAPADDPTPVFAGWPNFSSSSIPAAASDEGTAPTAADENAPLAAAEIDEAAAEQIAPEQAAPAEAETPAAEPSIEEPVVAESPAPEPEPEPAPQPETGDNPTEPIPVMAAAATSDIVHRALGLVDELRSLIPNLRAAAGPDHEAAAAILKEAGAGQSDSGDLSDLRAAIETAANRPRDIDVMMDLVSRAGAIQDLLAERDRLADAITRALAAMSDAPE